MDDFTLMGFSVGGVESVIIVPELDCAFDIGRCPHEALTINNVLLSHGHTDHVAGLPYYFAQREFQGIEKGRALVPAGLIDPLEDLLQVWGRIDGHVPPHEFIPMRDGDEYEIDTPVEEVLRVAKLPYIRVGNTKTPNKVERWGQAEQ